MPWVKIDREELEMMVHIGLSAARAQSSKSRSKVSDVEGVMRTIGGYVCFRQAKDHEVVTASITKFDDDLWGEPPAPRPWNNGPGPMPEKGTRAI